MISQKIEKLRRMARDGSEHEKISATRIIKKICEKYNLDFDEAMSDGKKFELHLTGVGATFTAEIRFDSLDDFDKAFDLLIEAYKNRNHRGGNSNKTFLLD